MPDNKEEINLDKDAQKKPNDENELNFTDNINDNDENDKMNLSIKDVNGSALVISQFTLCGDTKKGRRPSFIKAATPDDGNQLYEYFMSEMKKEGVPIECGEFGAMMDVALVNNGPVTFILNSKD